MPTEINEIMLDFEDLQDDSNTTWTTLRSIGLEQRSKDLEPSMLSQFLLLTNCVILGNFYRSSFYFQF